ncbi:MAG: adenosine deaminase [Candidatus Nanoarchaeia archaeon]|nr:adenosine deaminase [Candidatus Nanoarchaeia archaeon]MDD5740842.1 adenosine deaminase [Candidatus Nanoarchaeia archaeon]
MKNKIPKWLIEMPKAELHCHLGGSMRLDTILDLASNNHVRIPAKNKEELIKQVVFKNKEPKSLQAYLKGIKICESVLRKPEDFQRAAYEICTDAAKENVKVMELRFGPTNYASKKLKLHEIVEGALDGLKKAETKFNMYTGLIICGIKTNMRATKRAVEIAINYQDRGVVGFDLAGKENKHSPKEFKEIFKPIFNNFLPVTIHAGEEDTVESIKEALIHLHAKRIGHGVSLRENPKIIKYMDSVRIGLEVCPTSNIDTGSISDISTHPVRDYFYRGLRVCINTDNRTISDTNLTKEYLLLQNELGFGKPELLSLAKNGFKAAFMNNSDRRKILDEFDKKYGLLLK